MKTPEINLDHEFLLANPNKSLHHIDTSNLGNRIYQFDGKSSPWLKGKKDLDDWLTTLQYEGFNYEK